MPLWTRDLPELSTVTNAGGFLAAVLKRVQGQEREFGGGRRAADRHDAALLPRLVQLERS